VLRRYNYQYDSYVTKPVLFLAQMLLHAVYMSACGFIVGVFTQVRQTFPPPLNLIFMHLKPAGLSRGVAQYTQGCEIDASMSLLFVMLADEPLR
jgi:hypothetical protein